MTESKNSSKSQVDKFREAARELETDDSEEHFDAMVKKIAKAPKPTDEEIKAFAKRQREQSRR